MNGIRLGWLLKMCGILFSMGGEATTKSLAHMGAPDNPVNAWYWGAEVLLCADGCFRTFHHLRGPARTLPGKGLAREVHCPAEDRRGDGRQERPTGISVGTLISVKIRESEHDGSGPTVEHAYRDMKDLEFVVTLGLFWRNFHRWTAHAMVLTVIFHMARVFLTDSYRPPREFNWVVGVVLLVLTLLLSFTGYLLPWDQLAFWAITVGANMAGAVPLLGAEGPASVVDAASDVRFYLLGGQAVGQNALLRFYVLHCVGLPLLAAIFMAVHFWRIRKDGGISGPL